MPAEQRSFAIVSGTEDFLLSVPHECSPQKDKGGPFNEAAPCDEIFLRLRPGHARST
jgi:hypothetical protein